MMNLNLALLWITVWGRRASTAVLLSLVAFICLAVTLTYSSVSLGGLVSEKLLGRAGTAASSLLLGRAGTNTELSVFGFAPSIATVTATSSGDTATLRGRVTSMNGMPSATGYFQWGYAAGALTNTTAPFAIATVGDYSTDVIPVSISDTVFYRFMSDADGTTSGGTASFVLASGAGGNLLKTLLRVVIAAVIVIFVLILGSRGGFVVMLIAAIIGLVAFIFADTLLDLIN